MLPRIPSGVESSAALGHRKRKRRRCVTCPLGLAIPAGHLTLFPAPRHLLSSSGMSAPECLSTEGFRSTEAGTTARSAGGQGSASARACYVISFSNVRLSAFPGRSSNGPGQRLAGSSPRATRLDCSPVTRLRQRAASPWFCRLPAGVAKIGRLGQCPVRPRFRGPGWRIVPPHDDSARLCLPQAGRPHILMNRPFSMFLVDGLAFASGRGSGMAATTQASIVRKLVA